MCVGDVSAVTGSPLGLILYGDKDRGGENLSSLVRSLPGYAVELGVLQQDPNFSGLPVVDDYSWIEKSDYMQTARIPLAGTFDGYWATREDRLRKNNDRLRRRMAEKGLKLEFTKIRDPARVGEGLREFGRLESKGWKAGEGTAVGIDDAQARFYRAVLEDFCQRGEGVIYQLRIDGQVKGCHRHLRCARRKWPSSKLKRPHTTRTGKIWAPGVLTASRRHPARLLCRRTSSEL